MNIVSHMLELKPGSLTDLSTFKHQLKTCLLEHEFAALWHCLPLVGGSHRCKHRTHCTVLRYIALW